MIIVTENILRRFHSRVDRSAGPDACWPWTAYRDKDGYGLIRTPKRNERTHRMAYRIHTGSNPGKMLVCHSCDNPPCCNPAHLWLGTNQDNTADRHAKGRDPDGRQHRLLRGEEHGMAILTEEQARYIKGLKFKFSRTFNRKTVAAGFGVTEATIKAIRAGRIWKHIK